jgi:hypothetical protein
MLKALLINPSKEKKEKVIFCALHSVLIYLQDFISDSALGCFQYKKSVY